MPVTTGLLCLNIGLSNTSITDIVCPFFLLQKPKIMKKIKNFVSQDIGKPCQKVLDAFKKAYENTKEYAQDKMSSAKYTAMKVGGTGLLAAGSIGDVQGSGYIPGNQPAPPSMLSHQVESSVPNMNLLIGAGAKVSFREMARFIPFAQIQQNINLSNKNVNIRQEIVGYELRMPIPGHIIWMPTYNNKKTSEYTSSAFSSSNFLINAGVDFRITNRNFVRFAINTSGFRTASPSVGFIHRFNLSDRMNIQLDANKHFNVNRNFMGSTENRTVSGLNGFDETVSSTDQVIFSTSHNSASAGAKVKFRLTDNMNINAGVNFSHNVGASDLQIAPHTSTAVEDWADLDFDFSDHNIQAARNALTFSVGIHKRFGEPIEIERRQRQPSARAPRPHRVRQVACPHMQPRSWETPSRVFNHPTQMNNNRNTRNR